MAQVILARTVLLLYFNNNIASSISLLECMKKNKVFKLIFSSSACVYNADLADAHINILMNFKNIKGYEIYNFGSGKGETVLDIKNCFDSILQKKIPFRYKKRRSGDAQASFTQNIKSLKDLNWKVNRDISQAVKDVLKYIHVK